MNFDRLGEHVAREQDAIRAGSEDRAEVRAELAAMHPRSAARRARLRTRAAIGGALVAAAAAAAFAFLPVGPAEQPAAGPSQLGAKVTQSGQALSVGAFVEASPKEALGVAFSDGTRVKLAPGSRARLVELDATGAHVLLEDGEAHVDVVPRARAAWRFSAGPFVVRVKGTRFDVRWDAEQHAFELDLSDGEVEVSGCVLGAGYRMRAGQRVHASCERGRFDVTDLKRDAGTAATSPTAAAPAATPQPAEGSRPHAGSPVAAGAEPPPPARAQLTAAQTSSRTVPAGGKPADARWRALARQGKYAQAIEAGDFEQRCARAGAEELVLLAETARYAGEFDKEGHALRLLRRRFAGTPRAALAAYALGRLEFDVHGEHRKAAEWFGTYLREQPSGPLVREAHGRLLEATLKAGDLPRARTLARGYLRDYPEGPHAALARGLQEPASR